MNSDQQQVGKSLLRRFLEMIRFSHTVFALPFATLACVWGAVAPFPAGAQEVVRLAASESQLALSPRLLAWRVLGVIVCMVTARSAAMAFNRIADARFDAQNPRTKQRHLVSGELTIGQAWMFFGTMVLLFLGACCLFLPNWLPLAGAVPVMLWICGYSLAKRFTSAVHLWLGVALALSPICAWIALRGEVVLLSAVDVLPAVVLAMAIAVWVAGFDIIYACQDTQFDQEAGLYSLPARLGNMPALRVARYLHAAMLVILALIPFLFPQLSLGVTYGSGLLVVSILVARQHTIIRGEQAGQQLNLARINEAFFQLNAILGFCFCAAAAVDAYW